MKDNDRSFVLCMDDGHAAVKKRGRSEFEVGMDISDFLSLIMGAVGFEKLWEFGRAEISDRRYVTAVNRAFYCETKPLCLTAF